MTESLCWIDTHDDVELTEFLRQQKPSGDITKGREIELGSSCGRGYWINVLEEWATRQGLPIEYPDFDWIVKQVTVNRSQLLQFLVDHDRGDGKAADAIRANIQQRKFEGCRYRILADEY
jgi:hypothetical protein